MAKEDKTGFYLVLIVAVVAIGGLLLYSGILSFSSDLSLSSDSVITGSAVITKALVEKMDAESGNEMDAESTNEMEAESTDEFTVNTIMVSYLKQGNYYSVQAINGQLVIKTMDDPNDFSLAYATIKAGIKDKNYGLVKTLKATQLTSGKTYIAYYAGGEYFTFVQVK